MKLQKVSQTITPFAGISFIHEEFNGNVGKIVPLRRMKQYRCVG